MQIQIIGIKGFLVWKRVMNGYNVSRGWAKAQKTNTLIFWSFLNDVRLLIPVFNPNLAQIKKLGEYYILKVKLQLIKNQDQIILYHGMVKQRWVTFKIKTIKQLRYLLKTLAENVEILNHKANKLYQEALDHIKSKKKQIVSYHQLDTPYTSNSTPENLTNQSEIISDQQVAQLNQLNHQQVSEPQEQVQEQQQKRSESIEEDLLRDQQQQSDQQRELSQDEQCDLKYAQKLSEVKTPEQHSDKKQNDEDPQNIEKEDTLKVGEFRDYKEAKVEIQHNNEDIKSESNNDGPKGEQ